MVCSIFDHVNEHFDQIVKAMNGTTLQRSNSTSTFLNVDNTKAGMADVDKEKINRLIQEASKSSV